METPELESLLRDIESDCVERKASLAEPDRVREAICAFANDMPDRRRAGVIFIGARDDGSCANLAVTDELLRRLAGLRDDGTILPLPSFTVEKRTIAGCELAVVIVRPSGAPPVRFRGRTWIRVGPRRAIATIEEELRLAERRRARDLPFDLRPISAAGLQDLDCDLFTRTYLPKAIGEEALSANDRSIEERLMSLRFYAPEGRPTVAGLLVLGHEPRRFLPGAYVQFLRIDGAELGDPIRDQKEIDGPLPDLIRMVEELLKLNIGIVTEIAGQPIEVRRPDYPLAALQELFRNAVLHRIYEGTHAPIRITWFTDRVVIQNPGGPFGQVTRENFGRPGFTDYRNPHLAEAMKALGLVQRFGVGIPIARKELDRNGNPPLAFVVESASVAACVRRRP